MQGEDAGIGHGTQRGGRNRTACQPAPAPSSRVNLRTRSVGFS
ncbi:hypothetical protein XCR_2078 [Xanthomonas campestris pv. raphani 756C]|nr:hypothetical protein XCR_2078 [Xanthomonas campestris pv. raphani 756C]